ncbi:CopG family transcriptional regulator [Streptomyces hokutonensis]|uniref:ribbon-helix-helix domain-containing protein n=1 Tax=Streptomyces hokutonensis TaxID=1306990 RepID=UPI00382131A4
MPRVNVYTYPADKYDEDGPQLAGWFDPESATCYPEATEREGNNEISVNTGSQRHHQALYYTKGGRWVLNSWANVQGSVKERYKFIDSERALTWLVRNEKDQAVAAHFGEPEEEAGPNLGGRPAVGTKVETRLSDNVLAALDERARTERVSRAEMIRRLVSAGLEEAR